MIQAQSEELFAEALRYIPGGVNSPVRAFRAVGGTPFFAQKAYGSRVEDIDGNSLHRLRLHLGPVDPRPRASGGHRGGESRGRSRHELRHSESAGSRTRAQNLRMGAVGRKSAHDQQRHRGDHDRHPPRARLHRPGQDHQVRGLLPRPRRFASGQGRLGRAHARPARQRRHSRRARRAHHRPALQRRGRACVTPSSKTRAKSRR